MAIEIDEDQAIPLMEVLVVPEGIIVNLNTDVLENKSLKEQFIQYTRQILDRMEEDDPKKDWQTLTPTEDGKLVILEEKDKH